jgi:sortase A
MRINGTKLVGIFFGLLGLTILSYVLLPIVSYEFGSAPRYATYISPEPGEGTNVDYTKASNWLPEAPQADFVNSQVKNYTLSIPSLKIKKATVAIGGEDLSQSLIQYPGTANPGKPGNAVVFGHSVLPQFFDPKNYISIFSTLPTIGTGDEILVEYDGVSYLYKVEDKFEVSPTDIQILEQNNSDSFLTLVTCTPPGHPLRPKRLIVRARVVPYNQTSYVTGN